MALWMLIGLLLIDIIAAQDCPSNKVITASSGNITTPGYPAHYGPNLNCSWVIEAPAGKHVKFQFTDLDLEDCNKCVCDGIKLSIGKTSSDRKSIICQHDKSQDPKSWKAQPIYSIFNKIWLTFYSTAGPSHYKGFHAKYEIIDYTPPVCPADAVLYTGNSGSFSSPNYPNNYPDERRCYYLISVTDGPRVKLSFTNFTLEGTGCQSASLGKCTCDYVKVYDGENNSTLATLCGSAIPKPIVSNSKKMLIEFMSTLSTNYQGFNAEYKSTNEQAPTSGSIITTTSGSIITTTTAPTNPSSSSSGEIAPSQSTAPSTGSSVIDTQTTTAFSNEKPKGTASGITSFGLSTVMIMTSVAHLVIKNV